MLLFKFYQTLCFYFFLSLAEVSFLNWPKCSNGNAKFDFLPIQRLYDAFEFRSYLTHSCETTMLQLYVNPRKCDIWCVACNSFTHMVMCGASIQTTTFYYLFVLRKLRTRLSSNDDCHKHSGFRIQNAHFSVLDDFSSFSSSFSKLEFKMQSWWLLYSSKSLSYLRRE